MLYIPANKLDPVEWLICDLKWALIGRINEEIHLCAVQEKDYSDLTDMKQAVYKLAKPFATLN
jgi:hypothetical protein